MTQINEESANVALRELIILIKKTEKESPDPLTDDVYRAKKDIENALRNSQ